jgi:hypothetical protein
MIIHMLMYVQADHKHSEEAPCIIDDNNPVQYVSFSKISKSRALNSVMLHQVLKSS